MVLLSAIVLAAPALGVLTYYGGFDSSGASGNAYATGGAYYDIYDTPDEWNAEYGIDAYAETEGIGVASSYTSHSLETGSIPVTVGETNYNVELAYGGIGGAKVQALASQNTADTQQGIDTEAYANIYSYVSIYNDGNGDEEMYGEAEIYSSADVYDTNGEASASASGLAGYVAQKCPDCENGAEQIWGAVSGTSTSYAIAEGSCPACTMTPGVFPDAGTVNDESWIYTYSQTSQDISVPHSEYANSYSELYSSSENWVNQGRHVLGETTASGSAMSGAWDPSTSYYLIKQNGVNENVFSSVNGDTSAFGEGFILDDYAYSYADMWSGADSFYDNWL
jgi:hypothetical protein